MFILMPCFIFYHSYGLLFDSYSNGCDGGRVCAYLCGLLTRTHLTSCFCTIRQCRGLSHYIPRTHSASLPSLRSQQCKRYLRCPSRFRSRTNATALRSISPSAFVCQCNFDMTLVHLIASRRCMNLKCLRPIVSFGEAQYNEFTFTAP